MLIELHHERSGEPFIVNTKYIREAERSVEPTRHLIIKMREDGSDTRHCRETYAEFKAALEREEPTDV